MTPTGCINISTSPDGTVSFDGFADTTGWPAGRYETLLAMLGEVFDVIHHPKWRTETTSTGPGLDPRLVILDQRDEAGIPIDTATRLAILDEAGPATSTAVGRCPDGARPTTEIVSREEVAAFHGESGAARLYDDADPEPEVDLQAFWVRTNGQVDASATAQRHREPEPEEADECGEQSGYHDDGDPMVCTLTEGHDGDHAHDDAFTWTPGTLAIECPEAARPAPESGSVNQLLIELAGEDLYDDDGDVLRQISRRLNIRPPLAKPLVHDAEAAGLITVTRSGRKITQIGISPAGEAALKAPVDG